eukprot:CAMPEP_0203752856 /NCGR_PEP_ID=MMETSP0098-20131031/6721_1 /ASSEMBLY_ACC=CAM_ASM_000208 /TAXON_ID=96639 /ORGANISM=" , Strain NY0313808BC1" /LENGTH=359 /DNA_ID=CAMNT_0050643215 /DNA_START=23 /DNA_END=1099 /DNA_ORIENTATION=-
MVDAADDIANEENVDPRSDRSKGKKKVSFQGEDDVLTFMRKEFKNLHEAPGSTFTSSFTSGDGQTIGYAIGAPKKPKNCKESTVIMLPGLSGTAEGFIEWFSSLEESGANVVAMDYRGYGLSTGPWTWDKGPKDVVYRGLSIARLATDVKELVDHLGITKFSLLGHSIGVNVIMSFMRSYGNQYKINSLMLLDQNVNNAGVNPDADPSFPDIQTYPIENIVQMVQGLSVYDSSKPIPYTGLDSSIRAMFPVLGVNGSKAGFVTTENGINRWMEKLGKSNGVVFAHLMWNSLSQDFSDVPSYIRSKRIPVFVYAGLASIIPSAPVIWSYNQMVPESVAPESKTHKLLIFNESIGTHCPFL